MLYDIIRSLRNSHSLRVLCKVLAASRSGYYRYLSGETYVLHGKKEAVAQEVRSIFEEHQRRYGWRRIQAELRARGIHSGRYQIRQRMMEEGLVAIQP